MVQSTDTRDREDFPHFPRLDGSLLRCVLIEPQMRSILVVVVNIRLDLSVLIFGAPRYCWLFLCLINIQKLVYAASRNSRE